MNRLWIGLGLAFALSACATHSGKHAADASNKDSMKMEKSYAADSHSCQRDADVRRVWITEVSDQGGCKVMYEKYKETQSLAEAQHDLAYCDRVREKVLSNLQSAGYNCSVKTADRGKSRKN